MDARNTSSAQHAAKVIASGRNANEIAKPIAKIVGSAVFSPSLVAGLGQVDPIAAEQDKEPAGWVNALIDHLSLERFVIVGQDWGGPIGLSIAANRADDVAGLVIGNSFMWPPEAMMMRIFAAVMGGRIGKYLILRHNFFARRLMPAILNRPESKTAEIRKAYTDPFPTPESRMGTYIFPWALNNSGEWYDSFKDRLNLLAGKPVELVMGMKDIGLASDEAIGRWQGYFPDAGLDRIEDAGHFFQEDSPERTAAAIQRVLAQI